MLGPMSKTDDKIERKGNTGSYCPYAVPPIVCFEMQSDLGIAVLGCTAESSICQLFLETQLTDIRRAWNGQGMFWMASEATLSSLYPLLSDRQTNQYLSRHEKEITVLVLLAT